MSAREELAAIRERAGRATEGPWQPGYDAGWTAEVPDGIEIAAMTDQEGDQGRADAEFIAHARTDVPRLVGAVEAAMKVLVEVETTPGLHRITIGRRLRKAITDALTTDTKGEPR